jgi:NAD(P) transhydrogenase
MGRRRGRGAFFSSLGERQRPISARILTPFSQPVDNECMREYDLICIGSGPAGEKAASQASYFGHRVAMIERNHRPGGAMVNSGTLPSKALRETALLCSSFNRRPLPGVNMRLDRTISVPKFMAQRHMLEQQEHDRIERSIDGHGIDVYAGNGKLKDANTVVVEQADGTMIELRTKYVLIATGSSPLRPEHVPFHLPNVVDADGVLQLASLPASMVVVGGGVIGTEYACIFAEMGVHVTLVHSGDSILPFLDAECRQHLMQAMSAAGVEFKPNTSVRTVEPVSETTMRVSLDGSEHVSAETVLWAAGRSSNTAGLGLERIGVAMGNRGLVLVDDQYRTNVPSIYAAGDVIGFPALASTSMEQGRIAACNMFNIDFKKQLTANMPMGIYTIPSVATVGVSHEEAQKQKRDVLVGRAMYRDNLRGRMLGDNDGMLKCIFDRNTRALLGAAVVGEDATELIHLAQAVIEAGRGIEYFIHTCFNYPSLHELYKYAAYSALQSLAAKKSEPLAA